MSDPFKDMAIFVRLTDDAERIEKCGADSEVIFDAIFPGISSKIYALDLTKLDYYDPDTTYDEDVRAYVAALRERADEYKKILAALENTDG